MMAINLKERALFLQNTGLPPPVFLKLCQAIGEKMTYSLEMIRNLQVKMNYLLFIKMQNGLLNRD